MAETMPKPDTHGDDLDATIHHQSQRRRRAATPPQVQLNITPMIDVIFLLLIYFVVTASFAMDEGILTAKLPEGTGPAEALPKTPQRPIKIRLTSLSMPTECRIELVGIGRSPRHFKELTEQLAALQYNAQNPNGSFKPDNPLIIEPDGRVRWQHVVNAFNSAVKARYTNVAFAQAPQDDG